MKETTLIIDLSDPRQKRDLMTRIGATKGVYEFTVKPYKPRRNNSQNRMWWGVIVEAFRAFNEEQGVMYTAQQCHDILKMHLLPKAEFTNPNTGEVIDVPADSHLLDSGEFSSMIERAIAWLEEMGIQIPSPEIYTRGGV
jgi:hypothetical protein